MEDGEIHEDASGASYHPSLEFPPDDSWLPATSSYPDPAYPFAYANGDDLDPHAQASASASTASSAGAASPAIPVFRLLVLSSAVLPPARTLAVLDGHTQIEIGRDAPQPGATTPRVRLKEMEVSKLHATLFWDGARREWAVVDMGSKHGTFVSPPGGFQAAEVAGAVVLHTAGGADPRGQRLSPPRVASVPRRLRHLDELSIGTTTFAVHIHDDHVPCAVCSPKGGDEILLFHDKKSREDEAARKRKRDAESMGMSTIAQEERDPKRALTLLKRSLLSRHHALAVPSETKNAYTDRSAKRRALHVGASSDAPGVEPRSVASTPSTSAASSRPVTPSPPVSAPPTPLPSTNIGHKLLMKQGWQPGTTLGVADQEAVEGSVALIEPLEAVPRTSRTGLGAPSQPPPAVSGLSWKDEAKYRRWSNFRPDGGSG